MRNTPAQAGFHMPAEWEKHEGTWLQWPHDDTHEGSQMRLEHVWLAMTEALHQHEVVHIVVPDERRQDHVYQQEEARLGSVLPLVVEYGAAVIGLAMDDDGISPTAEKRLAVARKIVERAESLGIPREDLVVDCLVLTVGGDSRAGLVTLEAIQMVREELGVNMTLGASNVSFGLPEREVVNWAFLTLAIQNGVNCPIVDAAKVRPAILATDLLLGRDNYGMRYIKAYKKRVKTLNPIVVVTTSVVVEAGEATEVATTNSSQSLW